MAISDFFESRNSQLKRRAVQNELMYAFGIFDYKARIARRIAQGDITDEKVLVYSEWLRRFGPEIHACYEVVYCGVKDIEDAEVTTKVMDELIEILKKGEDTVYETRNTTP